MQDLKPTFEHYFPEGSVGGECAAFAEKLVAFGPVGDTLSSKLAYLYSHGSTDLNDVQVGDVLFTDDSKTNGHICVVNYDMGDSWRVSESNFNLDQKVHHNRTVLKNSPHLKGHVRAPLKVQIINPLPMITIKIAFANTVTWPDLEAGIAKFAALVAEWSNNQINVEIVNKQYLNFPAATIPLEDEINDGETTWRGPQYQWLIDHVFPIGAAADGIALITEPIPNLAQGGIENGYCVAPQRAGDPFTLFCATGDQALWLQTYGYPLFTKLALHELSHMLYGITGGKDQTHFYDFTPGHSLAEAFQNLDYGRLAANLELRRQQKVTTNMDTNTVVVFRDKSDPHLTLWLLEDAEWSGFADEAAFTEYLHGRAPVIMDLDHDQFVKLQANPAVHKS